MYRAGGAFIIYILLITRQIGLIKSELTHEK